MCIRDRDYTVVNGNLVVEQGRLSRVDEGLLSRQASQACDRYLAKQ